MNNMKFIRNFYEEQSRQGVHSILGANPPNEVKYMFAKNIMEIKEACLSHKPMVSLDVGCAEGYYTKYLGKFSRYAVGVDISSGYLRQAKSFIKKFNISNVDFVQADAQFLPFREESIDLVVCFKTLEHIPNMKGVVRGISKVLKDGGIFICSTPYDLTDIKPFDKLKELYITYDKRKYKFYTHIHTFSPKKLLSILRGNDLVTLKESYTSKTKKLIGNVLKLLPTVGRKLADRIFYDTEHLFVTLKKACEKL
jgi:SAM-dependent methyltransferase